MEAPRPREKRDVFALPTGAVRTESLPFMRILDRYVLRSFLEPFLMAFFGFLAIWLIIDLSDNGSDFLEAHASFK